MSGRWRQRPARLAQGRARRGQGRAQGAGGVGEEDRLQPRADPVPGRRGAGVARRRVRRRRRRGGRCAGALRGLDRQASRGARDDQPGRGAVLVHVDAGAVGRRGRAVRASTTRWRPWSPPSRHRWPPATPSLSLCPSARRCPAWTSARSSASPTSPAAWSTCCQAAPPSSSRPWPPTATSTRSSTRRRRRVGHQDRHLRRRDPQARHPRRAVLASAPRSADRAAHRLAPHRRLAPLERRIGLSALPGRQAGRDVGTLG